MVRYAASHAMLLAAAVAALPGAPPSASAFLSPTAPGRHARPTLSSASPAFAYAVAAPGRAATRLRAVTEDIGSMRATEMRKELESYGISTKSFFEKSELEEALRKARAEGRTPIKDPDAASSSSFSSSESSSSGKSRDERIKEEMEKLKSSKVGDLKKELQSLGVSTKSFFEKSEFVRALAEARVDGVKKRAAAGGSGARGGGRQQEEDAYDPSYRDVVMQKFNADPRDPRNRGPIIDIRLGR